VLVVSELEGGDGSEVNINSLLLHNSNSSVIFAVVIAKSVSVYRFCNIDIELLALVLSFRIPPIFTHEDKHLKVHVNGVNNSVLVMGRSLGGNLK